MSIPRRRSTAQPYVHVAGGGGRCRRHLHTAADTPFGEREQQRLQEHAHSEAVGQTQVAVHAHHLALTSADSASTSRSRRSPAAKKTRHG
jgi:hypothetical protein